MAEKQDSTKDGKATSVSRDLRAFAAAVSATLIGVALVAVLQKGVGIGDSATTVALLLVPLLVYGIVSGRLRELTGPGGWGAKFAEFETELEKTKEEVRAIQIALRGILTKHEFGPLKALDGIGKVEVKKEPNLVNYLHRLDGLNFIQPNPGRGLYDIEKIANDVMFDLRDYVHITDDGRSYLDITTKLKIFKSGVDWKEPYPWTPLPPSQ